MSATTSTVLGLWAHPDDEVFVAGGLMSDAVRRGARVVCVHMTRGEAGLSYRRRTRPESLARIRERELRASLARLGVREQRFFGYPDGALGSIVSENAIARIHELLVDVRPEVIVTFGPDGFTGHPDHQALSAWVTAAYELWNEAGARLYHTAVSPVWKEAFAPPLDEFDFFWPGYPIAGPRPDVSLRLDDALLTAKLEALRAHASQMSPLFDAYGDEFMRDLASSEAFQLAAPAAHSPSGVPPATTHP